MSAGDRWKFVALVTAMLAAILVPFALWGDQLESFALRLIDGADPAAMAGVVVGALALDVVLPLPSSVIATASGAVLGLWPGALAGWAGLTLGCVGGYLLGRLGNAALVARIVKPAAQARAEEAFARSGPGLLLLARAVPVLAEASVVTAGALRMPFGPFLATTTLANLVIALAYAAIGALAASAQMGWIVLATLGLPGVAWLLMRRNDTERTAGLQ
ncbi:TVP38/TMEM64 family protein [Roseisalinus antarcticus]|uniref:SNARE associated Golgi protein n=1 Tax=Roseisalinus antarcticus TaxID=254357 RepID=A0A1Y5RQH1_9RHOB|nr:VTT domain-containing protein [Roseisalinus antarcticus]SLN22840.1 SNARE associated Golgi protein [Roseisalinus antarcticus]